MGIGCEHYLLTVAPRRNQPGPPIENTFVAARQQEQEGGQEEVEGREEEQAWRLCSGFVGCFGEILRIAGHTGPSPAIAQIVRASGCRPSELRTVGQIRHLFNDIQNSIFNFNIYRQSTPYILH